MSSIVLPNNKLNPHRLLKRDMIWLMEHYCQHGHSYMEHPKCFFTEKPEDSPIVERIGFLDIESTAFKANMGFVLSYCIKEYGGDIIERVITQKEIRSYVFDKPMLRQFCQDIKQFDRIIVYWGKGYRFDIPFLRTRCLSVGLNDFPTYKELIVNDLFDIVKKQLCLQRNKLAAACEVLSISAKDKYPFDARIWRKAMVGHTKSLQYVLGHNREDVVSTELCWMGLRDHARSPNTSI